MKPYLTLTTLASLMAIATTSQALENCPEVSEIEQIAPGIYRANGEHGEWSGVLQGVAAKTAPVQYFEMALAIQEQQPAPQYFQYCTYGLGDQNLLDLRFLAKNESDFNIKTEGDTWKKEHGPFGIIYHVCENTAPQDCKFSLIQ
ncbi:DUF3757 domain-containing protein [Pseudomonas sp. Lz4W]|uniref:DUF3757 domain-containing protein n=1 Tax=Pseudomonas sp. Lz4W TaxID=1206777 RepID=UPI0002BF20E1